MSPQIPENSRFQGTRPWILNSATNIRNGLLKPSQLASEFINILKSTDALKLISRKLPISYPITNLARLIRGAITSSFFHHEVQASFINHVTRYLVNFLRGKNIYLDGERVKIIKNEAENYLLNHVLNSWKDNNNFDSVNLLKDLNKDAELIAKKLDSDDPNFKDYIITKIKSWNHIKIINRFIKIGGNEYLFALIFEKLKDKEKIKRLIDLLWDNLYLEEVNYDYALVKLMLKKLTVSEIVEIIHRRDEKDQEDLKRLSFTTLFISEYFYTTYMRNTNKLAEFIPRYQNEMMDKIEEILKKLNASRKTFPEIKSGNVQVWVIPFSWPRAKFKLLLEDAQVKNLYVLDSFDEYRDWIRNNKVEEKNVCLNVLNTEAIDSIFPKGAHYCGIPI